MIYILSTIQQQEQQRTNKHLYIHNIGITVKMRLNSRLILDVNAWMKMIIVQSCS